MGPNWYSLVLFAVITLFSCDRTESRTFDFGNENSVNNVNSLLDDPDVRRNVLGFILQNQGTSVEEIYNKLVAAGGNLELAINEINSELKKDILKIDEELIKINPENLKTITANAVQAFLSNKFPQNSDWKSALQDNISQQIAAKSSQGNDKLVEKYTVSVDTAKSFLDVHNLTRNKRSLQPRDFDIGQIVTDAILNIFQAQLSALIVNFLEDVKNLILTLYTSTPPTNEVESIIASVVNSIIQNVVQFITVVQLNVNGTLSNPPVASRKIVSPSVQTELLRSRRDILNNTDVQSISDGLLDQIIGPILDTVTPVLSPINSVVKDIISGVLSLITPLLGSIIITRIQNLIAAIVDILIPSQQL